MRRRHSPLPLLHAPEELEDPHVSVERARRVRTARVVVADYGQLQQDFPQLRDPLWQQGPEPTPGPLREEVRARIDAWLIRSAALISERQASQSRVNTPIETEEEPIAVYRPPRYGRAFVARVPDGLLDLKGTGVAPGVEPTPEGQSDGLLPLEKALADLCIQEVIDGIFAHAGVAFWTVPTYAVLDLGFDIILANGQRAPAGLQVRKAHRRPLGGAELPRRGSAEQHVKFEIEMLLRHYGVTSSNAATTLSVEEHAGQLRFLYGGKPIDLYEPGELVPIEQAVRELGAWQLDCVNIQNTREVSLNPSSTHLVDFGHYRVYSRFERPVLSLVSDRLMRWGGALGPDHPHFVAPHPDVALPEEHWGQCPAPAEVAQARGFAPGTLRPRATLVAYEWVQGLRSGALDRDAVRALMEAYVATATSRFTERSDGQQGISSAGGPAA
jgi:hypothetical protein